MGGERDLYDSNDGHSEALKASSLASHLLFCSGSFSLPFFVYTFSSCFCHYIISLQLSSLSPVTWSPFVTWLRLVPDPATVKQWKLLPNTRQTVNSVCDLTG